MRNFLGQKCQETGEPFRANIGRRRERKDSDTDKQAKQDEDGDESDEDGDELNDLYPGHLNKNTTNLSKFNENCFCLCHTLRNL